MKYRKPTKAIITDAGCASRFLPITKTVPKAMLPIGAKPIMQLVVEECANAGIEEIIIVATAEGKPIYEDYFYNAATKIKKQLASQGKDDRYAPIANLMSCQRLLLSNKIRLIHMGTVHRLLARASLLTMMRPSLLCIRTMSFSVHQM